MAIGRSRVAGLDGDSKVSREKRLKSSCSTVAPLSSRAGDARSVQLVDANHKAVDSHLSITADGVTASEFPAISTAYMTVANAELIVQNRAAVAQHGRLRRQLVRQVWRPRRPRWIP
jgi:hypothetical protein